ncbi:MAG: helix-turn-helix domain-containing protein [Lachnospiraceae bacterium]|nr:helix-turn-helix domain-containing protein [Candidatus Darwinimomas equi]
MNDKLKTKAVDNLFDAVLKLKTRDECYDFFEDLCTISEILSMAQRLEVAHLLSDGMKYQDIAKQTGASTATVSRVNRSLKYGNDGYELVIRRLKQEKN